MSSLKPLALLSLAALGFAAFGGKSSFTLESGKRYRFSVSVTPKVSDSDLAALQTGLNVAGMSNAKFTQGPSATGAQFDGVPEQETKTVRRGDILFSTGGYTLTFISASEIA